MALRIALGRRVTTLRTAFVAGAAGSDARGGWTAALFSCVAASGVAWGSQQSVLAEVAPVPETESQKGFSKWLPDFAFLSLETRRRTFFKYEKRIRSLSTPEKIFEYFSSVEQEGVKYMTAVDLMRALVPVYPPEGSPMERGGSLLGEKTTPTTETAQFFRIFDVDGDNLISFDEFVLVLTLLSIPLKHIQIVFDIVDVNDNGVIDREEFMAILDHMKRESFQAKRSRGGLRTGLKKGTSGEASGLLIKFFGRDGRQKLKLPEFKAFLDDLHKNLLILEFMHYDYQSRNVIGGRDFARSLCAFATVTASSKYLEKVACMNGRLSNLQIEREEFLAFYSILDRMAAMQTALQFFQKIHGPPSAEIFTKIMKKLTGIEIPSSMVDIVFYLFSDETGLLDVATLMAMFEARCR